MIALSEYLAHNYGVDDRVTELLDTVEVHILPTLNPDGFETKALFFVDSVRQNIHRAPQPSQEMTNCFLSAPTGNRQPSLQEECFNRLYVAFYSL